MAACGLALIKLMRDQAILLSVFEREHVTPSPEARQKLDLDSRTLPGFRDLQKAQALIKEFISHLACPSQSIRSIAAFLIQQAWSQP